MKTPKRAQLLAQHESIDNYVLADGFDHRDIQEFILQFHESNGDIDSYIFSLSCDYTVVILPVTGNLYWGIRIKTKLRAYNYCPDERTLTFKLLGRPSPGLPPPISLVA